MQREVARLIRKCRKICISSHIMPDGDSVGSGLALYMILQSLGKDVRYYNRDRAPFPISRFPGYEVIKHKEVHPESFDAVILIEGGDEQRTGQSGLSDYFTINIDHHSTSPRISNINWIVPGASAVGELVYLLAGELGVPLSRDMGFNLFAAISSDTGSFKYSNTSGRTLKIASRIVEESGVLPNEVSNLLFNTNRVEKIRLVQKILSTLTLRYHGQVSIIEYRRDFLKGSHLEEFETEDIVSMARSIMGVKVTLFFKEVVPGKYRISIRSRQCINAQVIAKRFNGGGHDHAAGFYYRGDLEEGKRRILQEVIQQLKNDSRTHFN